MSTNQKFDDLLQKYIKGRCSKIELDRLLTYLESEKYNDEFESRIKDELSSPSLYEEDAIVRNIADAAQLRIRKRIAPDTEVKKWNYRWYAVAAVFAVVLSFGLYFLSNRNSDNQSFAKENDVKPGSNKATLTISDGKSIALSEEKGQVVSADGRINYGDGQQISDLSNVSLVTISTPKGGQYQAVLPDGTKVWLNAESSISFPSRFSEGERVVNAKGELFFDVWHDQHHPFKVKLDEQTITVRGTTFNVYAYDDEKLSQTTLLTGKIDVLTHNGEALVLSPGQMLSNDKSTNLIKVKAVNPEVAIAWKNGYFLFDKEPVESVMRKISRWYDVGIEFANGENVDEVFGGSIPRNINLREVLDILETIGDVKFKIEGKKVIVLKK